MSKAAHRVAGPSPGRKSDFICKLKFTNNLPDIPFEPKFLVYPFDSRRFVNYQTTSLEKEYKHQIHTEPDLGIPIDLIDPDAYQKPATDVELPPEDLRLLEDDDTKSKAVSVPWLRKSDILTGFWDNAPRFKDTRESEKKATNARTTRDDQIAAIERSFDAAKRPPKPPRPGLHVVDDWPVFPDFNLWPNSYNQVVFDREPAIKSAGSAEEAEVARMEAVLKGYTTDAGESYIAMIVPQDKKRKRTEEDEQAFVGTEEEFIWDSEYRFRVKKGDEFVDSFMWVFDETDQCVYYNEINTRFNMSKFRAQEAATLSQPAKVTLLHRKMHADEEVARELRKQSILSSIPLGNDDDEEIEDEDEEEVIKDVDNTDFDGLE